MATLNLSQEHTSPHRWRACLSGLRWLLIAVAIVIGVVGYFGSLSSGSLGWAAAATAGLVCFVSAATAFSVTVFSSGTPKALSGLLLSVLLRTAVPFLAAVVLVNTFPGLASAGLFGMLVITYLVALTVETWLAVRVVQSDSMVVK